MSARLAAMNDAATSAIDLKLLIPDDFANEQSTLQGANEAFSGLLHIEHIEDVLRRLEAMVSTAKAEGRKPHDEVGNMHLVFIG